MKKVFEFCGSPEMLIALLYSDDVCQTIKDEVRASRKVSLFMFAEEEPYYVPDNDDIQITQVGEDIRPQVNFGEAVQVVDDLRFGDIVERDQLNVQFDGADEMMGQKAVEMQLRETRSHEWMEGDDAEVVGV